MTSEEAAYAILAIYDVPETLVPRNRERATLLSAFLESGRDEAAFDGGLQYAVERGWLERNKHNIISLSRTGLEKIEEMKRQPSPSN